MTALIREPIERDLTGDDLDHIDLISQFYNISQEEAIEIFFIGCYGENNVVIIDEQGNEHYY